MTIPTASYRREKLSSTTVRPIKVSSDEEVSFNMATPDANERGAKDSSLADRIKKHITETNIVLKRELGNNFRGLLDPINKQINENCNAIATNTRTSPDLLTESPL